MDALPRASALQIASNGLYTAAGATTITMVPFTWLMMAPTNNTLFRLEALASAMASAVDLSAVQELVVR